MKWTIAAEVPAKEGRNLQNDRKGTKVRTCRHKDREKRIYHPRDPEETGVRIYHHQDLVGGKEVTMIYLQSGQENEVRICHHLEVGKIEEMSHHKGLHGATKVRICLHLDEITEIKEIYRRNEESPRVSLMLLPFVSVDAVQALRKSVKIWIYRLYERKKNAVLIEIDDDPAVFRLEEI